MNSTLTPEQNERVTKAANRLLAKFGDNVTALARALELSTGTVSRILRGLQGASHTTAGLIARELGVSLNELLGISFQPSLQIQDLPGFNRALVECKRHTKYSDEVWSEVGETILQPHPVAVDTMFLMRMAEIVLAMRVNVLTSGSDTSPPSRPGGQRTSGSKIKKR